MTQQLFDIEIPVIVRGLHMVLKIPVPATSQADAASKLQAVMRSILFFPETNTK